MEIVTVSELSSCPAREIAGTAQTALARPNVWRNARRLHDFTRSLFQIFDPAATGKLRLWKRDLTLAGVEALPAASAYTTRPIEIRLSPIYCRLGRMGLKHLMDLEGIDQIGRAHV